MRRPASDRDVPHVVRHATRQGPACVCDERTALATARQIIATAPCERATTAADATAAGALTPGSDPGDPKSAADQPEPPGPAIADPAAAAAVASARRDAKSSAACHRRARAKPDHPVTIRSRALSRARGATADPMDPAGVDDGKRKKLFGEETAALFQQARKAARALQAERERKDKEREQQQSQALPLDNSNNTHTSIHNVVSQRPVHEVREGPTVDTQAQVQRPENTHDMPHHTQPFRCANNARHDQQLAPLPSPAAFLRNTTQLGHPSSHPKNGQDERIEIANDVRVDNLDRADEDVEDDDEDDDEDYGDDEDDDDDEKLDTGHDINKAQYFKDAESGVTAGQNLDRSLSDVIDAVDRHHLQPGRWSSLHVLHQIDHSSFPRTRSSGMLPNTDEAVQASDAGASEGLIPDLHALLEREIDFEAMDANELLDEALTDVPPLRRAQSDSGRTRTKVNEQFAYLAAALPAPAPGDQPPKTQGEILKRSSRYFHFLLGRKNLFNAHIALVSRSHLRQWVRTTLGLLKTQPHSPYLEAIESTLPSPIVGAPIRILQRHPSPASQQRQREPETTRSRFIPVVGATTTVAIAAPTMTDAPTVGSLSTLPASSMTSPTASSLMSQAPSLNLSDYLSLPELLERFAFIYCLSRNWKYAEIWFPPAPSATAAGLGSIGVGGTPGSGSASSPQPIRHSIVQNPTNSSTLSAHLMQVPSSLHAGIPARVAARARPEWFCDQEETIGVLPHSDAASPRLRTTLCTPVLAAPGVVTAVLVFRDTDDRRYDGAELDRTILYGNTVVQAYMEALPIHESDLVDKEHRAYAGSALNADWGSGSGVCF